MPGQSSEIDKGGTLPLGAYPCVIQPGTTMERCYGSTAVSERHRHRYEFNNEYRDLLKDKGLVISGCSPDGRLVETVELADRPFYVGVQFHPGIQEPSEPSAPPFYMLHRSSADLCERTVNAVDLHEECGVFGDNGHA